MLENTPCFFNSFIVYRSTARVDTYLRSEQPGEDGVNGDQLRVEALAVPDILQDERHRLLKEFTAGILIGISQYMYQRRVSRLCRLRFVAVHSKQQTAGAAKSDSAQKPVYMVTSAA